MRLALHKLPLRHCEMATWDFARLYTNIPLVDLLDKLFLVTRRCFARASRTHANPLIVIDRFGKASWNTADSRVTNRASFFFSEEGLRAALDTVINGTFFVYGGNLYHQDRGIPMGINCAVHMADQYLWTYEFEFLLQLVAAATSGSSISASANVVQKRKHAIKLLKNYACWTCRYIDDLLTLGNPHLKKLLYVITDRFCGFKGIYPNCLTLSQADFGTSVHFLDMDIFQGEDFTLVGLARKAILVRLFDKRLRDGL